MQINKENHKQAVLCNKSITVAINSLQKLSYCDGEVVNDVNSCVASLQSTHKSNEVFIAECEEFKSRADHALISHANKRLYKIQQLLKSNAGEIARMADAYTNRKNDAITAQVPLESFKPLTKEPTEADNKRVEQERVSLLEESSQLNEFISSNPFLDIQLLRGTGVEKFIKLKGLA